MESFSNILPGDDPQSESQNQQERPVILVVDDEEEIRRVMRLTLTIAGYEVREAEDGLAALDSMQHHLPDLILLDLLMPGMDGFEVCESVRADSTMAKIPILILSARTDSRSKEKALSVGATKYLTKPISPPQLLDQIGGALEDAAQ